MDRHANSYGFSAEREVAEEHSAIRAIAHWIDVELTRQVESCEGVRSDGPLLGPLRSFRDHLEEHFRFEEDCGILAAAILQGPHPLLNLQKWRGQHRRLLARIDEVVRVLESAPAGVRLEGGFAEELRGFFLDLGVHDQFENELLGQQPAQAFRERQLAHEG